MVSFLIYVHCLYTTDCYRGGRYWQHREGRARDGNGGGNGSADSRIGSGNNIRIRRERRNCWNIKGGARSAGGMMDGSGGRNNIIWITEPVGQGLTDVLRHIQNEPVITSWPLRVNHTLCLSKGPLQFRQMVQKTQKRDFKLWCSICAINLP